MQTLNHQGQARILDAQNWSVLSWRLWQWDSGQQSGKAFRKKVLGYMLLDRQAAPEEGVARVRGGAWKWGWVSPCSQASHGRRWPQPCPPPFPTRHTLNHVASDYGRVEPLFICRHPSSSAHPSGKPSSPAGPSQHGVSPTAALTPLGWECLCPQPQGQGPRP